jgi:hypothetical protein
MKRRIDPFIAVFLFFEFVGICFFIYFMLHRS